MNGLFIHHNESGNQDHAIGEQEQVVIKGINKKSNCTSSVNPSGTSKE